MTEHLGLDQAEMFEKTKNICNALIKEDGMSDDYIVKWKTTDQ